MELGGLVRVKLKKKKKDTTLLEIIETYHSFMSFSAF